MKRCLSSPFYNCRGNPTKRVKLHYDLVTQPDGTTKRIWHRYVICILEPHYCGHSQPCQLPLQSSPLGRGPKG